MKIRFKSTAVSSALRRIFSKDQRNRGFLKKYILRFRTFAFISLIYITFFLKFNFLGIVPLLTGGHVSLTDFHTDFANEIILKNLHIRDANQSLHIGDHFEEIDILCENVSLKIQRQKSGEKLLAFSSIVVNRAKVKVHVVSEEALADNQIAFRQVLKILARVRKLALTEKVKVSLSNVDFSFKFKSSEKEIAFNLNGITGPGEIEITPDKFCPSLENANLNYKNEKFKLSTKGCIKPDFVQFKISSLTPLSGKNEKLSGNVKAYPYLKYTKAQVRIKAENLRPGIIFPQAGTKRIAQLALHYSLYDQYRQKITLQGKYRNKPFQLEVAQAKSESEAGLKTKWSWLGGEKELFKSLADISKTGLSLPKKLNVQQLALKGEDNFNGTKHHGQVKILALFKSPTLLSFKASASYNDKNIQVKNLVVASNLGNLKGSGEVTQSKGWNLHLDYWEKSSRTFITDIAGRKLNLNILGQVTIKGPFKEPSISGKFTSKNLSYILYAQNKNDPAATLNTGAQRQIPGIKPISTTAFLGPNPGNKNNSLTVPPIGNKKENLESAQRKGTQDSQYQGDALIQKIYFYHELSFIFQLKRNKDQSLVFKSHLRGNETQKDQKNNNTFWAFINLEKDPANNITGTGLIQNFSFQGIQMNTSLQLSREKDLLLRLHDLNAAREGKKIISAGILVIKKEGSSYQISTNLSHPNYFELKAQASLKGQLSSPDYRIDLQSKIFDLSVLSIFNLDLNPIKGVLDAKFQAQRENGENSFSLECNSSELSIREKSKPEERLFKFMFATSIKDRSFSHLLKLTSFGDASNQDGFLAINFAGQKNPGNLFALSSDDLHLAISGNNFLLDKLNPVFKGLGIKNNFRNGWVNGKLDITSLQKTITHQGSFAIHAGEWEIAQNNFQKVYIFFQSQGKMLSVKGSLSKSPEQIIEYLPIYKGFLKPLPGSLKLDGFANTSMPNNPQIQLNLIMDNLPIFADNNNFITLNLKSLFTYQQEVFSLKGEIFAHNGKIFLDEFSVVNTDKKKPVINREYMFIFEEILKNWKLDLKVNLAENVWLKSNLGNLELVGGGRFIIDQDTKYVKGLIRVNRGFLYIQNNNFEIEHGHFSFTGLDPAKYHIDLEAKTEIPEKSIKNDLPVTYEIYFSVKGELARPVITFYSEPTLTRDRILTALLTGQVIPYGGGGTNIALATSATTVNILANFANSFIEKQTGIDTFKIHVKEDTNNSNRNLDAQVRAGKYLTKRLYMQADAGGANFNEYALTMEYNLTRWLKLSGTRKKEDGKDNYNALLFVNFSY